RRCINHSLLWWMCCGALILLPSPLVSFSFPPTWNHPAPLQVLYSPLTPFCPLTVPKSTGQIGSSAFCFSILFQFILHSNRWVADMSTFPETVFSFCDVSITI